MLTLNEESDDIASELLLGAVFNPELLLCRSGVNYR